MRAITLPSFGGPEVLTWAEVPDPVPADGEVLVEVANEAGDAARAGLDARDDGGGHGIPGMRERARLYGGTLEVDRRDGRHAVRARLPLGDPGA